MAERACTDLYITSSWGWMAHTPSSIFTNCSDTSTFCSRERGDRSGGACCRHAISQTGGLPPGKAACWRAPPRQSRGLSFPVRSAVPLLDQDGSPLLELVVWLVSFPRGLGQVSELGAGGLPPTVTSLCSQEVSLLSVCDRRAWLWGSPRALKSPLLPQCWSSELKP